MLEVKNLPVITINVVKREWGKTCKCIRLKIKEDNPKNEAMISSWFGKQYYEWPNRNRLDFR